MRLAFLLAACAFVAILAVLVASIDRWRESRLIVARATRARLPDVRVQAVPASRKRAA